MRSMHKLTIMWGIFMVIIFGSLTAFGFFYKDKVKVYKELEEKLLDVGKKYVADNFLYPTDKGVVKVFKEDLIDEQYLTDLKVADDNCDGFVKITDLGNKFDYKSYIKCDNYKTIGY